MPAALRHQWSILHGFTLAVTLLRLTNTIPSISKALGSRYFCVYQSKLYREGHLPVFRVMPGKSEWTRIPTKCYNLNDSDKNYKASFKFMFPEGSQRVYFAYSFPWSTNDNIVDRCSCLEVYRQAHDQKCS